MLSDPIILPIRSLLVTFNIIRLITGAGLRYPFETSCLLH